MMEKDIIINNIDILKRWINFFNNKSSVNYTGFYNRRLIKVNMNKEVYNFYFSNKSYYTSFKKALNKRKVYI